MAAAADPVALPVPPPPDAPPELETELLGPVARAVGREVPPGDGPTLGEPADASAERVAIAERREGTVTTGADALTSGALTEPTVAFVVTLGAFVESAEGTVTFTVIVGAFGDGVGVSPGAEGFVAAAFVVEANGVVTETLGKATVPAGVSIGTPDVLTVTEGRLSDEAVGTCASAMTSVEATQAERAFLRDFIRRAIHNP